ncbi:MAG: hypothetical protein L0H84_16055, partial [Pseudonocardia sp.]|nr:hypothetical protein [Pseudonocardia sp.]
MAIHSDEDVGVDDDHTERLPTEAVGEKLVDALGQVGPAARPVPERRRLAPSDPLPRNAIDESGQDRQYALGLRLIEAVDELVQLLSDGHTPSMTH